MLVGELTREGGYDAGLGGVEVEFEPLVAEAVVVDLETPFALAVFVAEFSGRGFSLVKIEIYFFA